MKIRNCAHLGLAVAVGVALIGCSEGSDGASSTVEAFEKTLGSVEAAAEGAADSAATAIDETAEGARKAARKAGDAVTDSIDSAESGLEDTRSDLARSFGK